jgi:hypothetical protein
MRQRALAPPTPDDREAKAGCVGAAICTDPGRTLRRTGHRPVHEFFDEDLLKRARGSRRRGSGAPVVRASILAFIVSAAVHEYVIAVPLGRVQGYQTAFFLVQGAAVAATLRVKPRGRHAAPWIAATFAFNVVTSVLFFASLDGVVPFYQHRPPLWDGKRSTCDRRTPPALAAPSAFVSADGFRTSGV